MMEEPNKQEDPTAAAFGKELPQPQIESASSKDDAHFVDATSPLPSSRPPNELGEVEERPLSRRRFLRSVGAGIGLLAAACGRQPEPTPTPTPTRTPRPPDPTATRSSHTTFLPDVQANDPDVIAAAQPVIEPTPTKSPPTATPAPPTATPTPMTTPFPPGPPSKLGVHVERNDPQLFALLETGSISVVKTLELDAGFAAQIKQASPRTRLIGRIHTDQVSLATIDPIATARAFVEKLLPFANDPARKDWFDAWEAYNEPVPGNAEEMKRLAEFEAERTRLLADYGIRSVIGNFGTGQPPIEQWEHFLPAMQAAKQYDGWLGLHEYAAPTIYFLSTRADQGRYPGVSAQDTGWLTLRYRHVYNKFLKPRGLAIPLVMTELGVDGLVQAGRPGPQDARGWQHFQDYWAQNGYGLWGPGAYVEQLVWYDRAMQQDDYVIGGCIYGLGTSNEWISYDIGNTPVIGVMAQYLGVHRPA